VRRVLLCAGCGDKFPHAHGADRFCDDDCREDHKAALAEAERAILSNGFSRDEATPNLFHKDGVAISIEQVMDEGMDNVLAAHDRARQQGLHVH
jgi:hypothetical protein